jgi:RNA polymerase sigma factor (TIGR02999 family)
MSSLGQLLDSAAAGDQVSVSALLPLVYDELRRVAAAQIDREAVGQSLTATALVHEAYLRLVGDQTFDSRAHFFAAAAEAMRRVLVDAARKRARLKRGGDRRRIDLRDVPSVADLHPDDLLDLDAALTAFAAEDPTKAELVRLRFFAGLSVEKAADLLGVSRATAERHWTYARTWLFDRLTAPGEKSADE